MQRFHWKVRLRGILRRQHGVIHRAQALAAGMTPAAIQYRIETGEFVRILPRVYRDTSTPLTYQQRLMAALLWAGDGSCVSHRAAGKLWKMDGCEAEVVEISCPRYLKSPVPWLVVHRVSASGRDTGLMQALRVTSPHRTLLDLGAVVSVDTLELALEDALRRRLTSIARLEQLLARTGGRGYRGAGVLRTVLARRPPGARPTASALETRAIQEIRRQGLPPPERQFVILDGKAFVAQVDLAYPRRCLVIEVDSREHHDQDPDWARDLERRNRITALGYTVMHVTHDNLVENVRAIGRCLAR
jgi:very-short-patch-repair endonuclease